jgi:hypothetical protein
MVEFRITIYFWGWNSFFQLSKQNSTWLKDTRPHLSKTSTRKTKKYW